MQETTNGAPLWKRILFPDILIHKSKAHKIAYIGVVAALSVVTNVFEVKFADVQFSFTVFSSVLAGILIGPVFGCLAVFLGDGIGYLINSMGYPYYWWVALASATMALIAGLVMKLPLRFKGSVYWKLSLICMLCFILCSFVINTFGMYYIGLKIYLSPGLLKRFEEYFGGRQSFWGYVFIRYFIEGQLYFNLLNYALLFFAVPLLKAAKPLHLDLN